MRSPALDRALLLVGDRWSLLIVAALLDSDLRYTELAERLSASGEGPTIAPNVLASRLRHLESARLISAEPYQDRPQRFRYALTLDGRELSGVLGSLEAWADREVATHSLSDDLLPAVGDTSTDNARNRSHHHCGTPLEWKPWCSTCGITEDSDPASQGRQNQPLSQVWV
jgi:DNA-binding HxlR family transcriptional regulator